GDGAAHLDRAEHARDSHHLRLAGPPIGPWRSAGSTHGVCMTWHRVRIMLGLLALASPSVAQQPLTLAEAQAEARARAPEAAELAALVRGAEAMAAQATRRFRQNAELSASYFNGALTSRPEETAWSVGVRLPVDVSGSWRSRGASANADLGRTRFER